MKVGNTMKANREFTAADKAAYSSQYRRERQYWMETLLSTSLTTGFPIMTNGKRTQDARVGLVFEKELNERLSQLTDNKEQRVYVVLTTAIALLIRCYTREPSIALGMNATGRETSYYPLVLNFAGGTNFKQALGATKRNYEQLIANSAYPIELIAADLESQSDLQMNAVTRTRISLNSPSRSENVEIDHGYMTWVFEFKDAQLSLSVNFDASIYNVVYIDQLVRHFDSLLRTVLINPAIDVDAIEYMSEQELERLSRELAGEITQYPRDNHLCAEFAAQVARNPKKPALVCHGITVTYEELEQKSADLAAYLESTYGIKPNDPILIWLDKSVDAVVAIFAALKLGAIYVPIDTAIPVARLQKILGHLNPALVITDSNRMFELGELQANLFISDIQMDSVPVKAEFVDRELSAENSAYVMYTSGTTGEPKGVEVTHRGIIRLTRNTNYVTFNESARTLLASSLAFDASTFELWGMLLNGGTVYIEDKERLLDSSSLSELLTCNKITHMWFTAAWFNQLVDINVEIFSHLNYLLVGGDTLSPRHIKKVKEACPQVKVINGYGPTENTTFSTFYEIPDGDFDAIPLGRPIANSTVYIINEKAQLLPPGSWGEIAVGGDGVAKGYFHHAVATQAKFTPLVVNGRAIDRIYHTGDSGRMLVDGTIEFGGRKDHQVKIRGFRIELNEIERAIAKRAGINEVRVMLKEVQSDKCLCAYIVLEEGTILTTGELRNELSQQLPEYMIPQYFQFLRSFPLTINGKLDASKLPEPNEGFQSVRKPNTELQQHVAKTWARLLELNEDNIGLESNFFDIGGHSLKATVFIAQIQKEFGASITLNDIFQTPNLGDICSIIASAHKQDYVALPVATEREHYAASSTQRRMYMIQEMRPGTTTYNIPLTFSWDGPLNRAKLAESLNNVVANHDGLRTSFHMFGNQIVQKVHPVTSVEITFVESSGQDSKPDIQDWITRFDLSQAPLISVTVFAQATDRYLVLVDIHHIVFDAVSMDVFMRDWSEAYNGRSLKRPGFRYVDYAEWQNSDIGRKQLERHEAYWLNRFQTAPQPIKLPLSRPRPPIQTFEGATICFSLDSSKLALLKQVAKTRGSTLFITLLSLIYVWLNKVSGSRDIVVGSPVAGRTFSELSDVIGMFVNTLPLRANVEADLSVGSLIDRVTVDCLQAFENQAYPFESIVENTVVEKDLSRNPLFDVMFALQNADSKWPMFDGSYITPFYHETKTAKFDLNIAAYEQNDKLEFGFEYNSNLFSERQAHSLIDCLQHVIHLAVNNIDAKIGEISSVSSLAETQLIDMGRGHSAPFGDLSRIPSKLQERCAKNPGEVAVICENTQITFQLLDELSNRMANGLIERGHCQNEIVAIRLERGIPLIAAMVAVQKLASSFVIIDPDLPCERSSYMLEDCGARYLIVEDNVAAGQTDIKALALSDAHLYPCTAALRTPSADSIAYIIYTSGSTGRPKGVRVSYGALTNFMEGMQSAFDNKLNVDDVFLSNAKSSFDAFIAEVMLPLWYGGRICINKSENALDVETLASVIINHKVTFCYLPLLLLKPVLSKLEKQKDQCALDKMFFGAEPIKDEILNDCRRVNPEMHVLNAYGPTENTVCTTLYDCRWHQVKGEYLPIGRPMNNVQVLLVDEDLNLVPQGVIGELLIAGGSLASGYTNAKETSDKFTLWNAGKPLQVYRTGDLCRWNEREEMVFVGRKDAQIKLRGVRIEPAEIEVVLSEHGAVGEVVVQLRRLTGQDEQSLIAYYRSDVALTDSDLRAWCKARLPTYMIPDFYVHLADPPVNLSGKIDRKHLPEPMISYVDDYVAPKTSFHRELVALWSEVLGLNQDKISIARSFFELGGNSLKLLNLWNRIKERYRTDLRIVDLFTTTTIDELAKHLESNVAVSGDEIVDFSF